MSDFLKKNYILFLSFVLPLTIFFPSFSAFYTNDDFFLLKISNIRTVGEFLNFFNFMKCPEGLAVYRPLTTQVFYFLSNRLFDLNPLWSHIISFIFLFAIIYLIFRIALEIFGNQKIASLAALLYATSASHFGHLYYLATFQELGMTFFVLLSCLFFLKTKKLAAFIFFILALMSKETAIVTPFLLILISWFKSIQGKIRFSFLKSFISLVPYFLLITFYLLI